MNMFWNEKEIMLELLQEIEEATNKQIELTEDYFRTCIEHTGEIKALSGRIEAAKKSLAALLKNDSAKITLALYRDFSFLESA